MDTAEYIRNLEVTDALREPVIRQAAELLAPRDASLGLDVGSGVGSQAVVLADVMGMAGEIIGVDATEEFLERARVNADTAGVGRRVRFVEGDMRRLPFPDDSFDWLWSSDCVLYHPGDSRPALQEMLRVGKPGATVAILAWSSQVLLTGHPWLEAKLNATAAGLGPFLKEAPPERHFFRGLAWMRKIGFTRLRARTLVRDLRGPLTYSEKDGLEALIAMRWGEARLEVSDEDWTELKRLTGPGSPDYLFDRDDYYGFFTYTMFTGCVPSA
jgi:SAM-dependent methyltransferase